MKIFFNKNKLIKFIKNEKNLGFIPTMGSIHMGHASLVKKSVSQCNKTIVSIFVNKQQFNRKLDYQKYPRTLKKDILLLRTIKGVDFVYIPKFKDVYTKKRLSKITINNKDKSFLS